MEIERRLVALGEHRHDGSAAAAFASRLDNLLPQQTISVNQFQRTRRLMVNQGGDPFPFDPNLTPYMDLIGDALDHEMVRVVAVKGNTRSGKTVAAEGFVLRDWTYGPLKNVIWFMQDEDSLSDYIDERGEEMLQIHPEVNEKIDWTDKRNGRYRKRIGRSLALWRPATSRALRAKAAPTIVADEIDAYNKKVRDAIMTLIRSRQEEFGNAAKAYLCSHPDAGPDGGIDAVLKDSLNHLWFVRCPHCGGHSSPAAEADDWGAPRMRWNVPEMAARSEDTDRDTYLNYVEQNVVLSCPHDGCHATFDPDERIELMRGGQWLQQHQSISPEGLVIGEARVAKYMGFVIHAFMAPFVDLRETARDWAAAKLTYDQTGLDTHLREVTVKKLGETFGGADDTAHIDTWQTVQARIATHYPLKCVPTGCVFLTAFVDVGGDNFDVRVIGWSLDKQSWLIDAYTIKNFPAFGNRGAFENISPGQRLSDWDIIEEAVLAASYPLQANPQRVEAGLPELFLPIARTMVDAVGVPGVSGHARTWLANMLSRKPSEGKRIIPDYRVKLVHGGASKTQKEIYGKPKMVTVDDNAVKLAIPVYERYPNVHEIKRIIAARMKIDANEPGMMHMPATISARYYRELTAERLINGDWIRSGRNETWDGWVMCEVARETLKPDRPELWNQGVLPEWADPRPRGEGIDAKVAKPVSLFDRLAKANEGT